MCVFNVPVAHAGQWEIVPLERYPFGYYSPEQETTPQYKSWLVEARKRYEGQNTFAEPEPPKGQPYPVRAESVQRQHLDKLPLPFQPRDAYSADTRSGVMYWWNSPSHRAGAYSIGGAASVISNGQTNAVIRHCFDIGEDKSLDPVDPVFLKVNVNATSGAGSADTSRGEIRELSKEHVRVSITPKGEIPAGSMVVGDGDAVDTGASKYASVSTEFHVKFSPKGKTEVDSEGNIIAIVPLVSTELESSIEADRATLLSGKYYNWNSGSVGATVQGTATLANLSLGFSRTGAHSLTSRSDPNFNADRDEYIDEDGNLHGHTTYSYVNRYALRDEQPHLNVQSFSAGVSVPPGVTGQWQWAPSSDNDTQQSHSQEMPMGTAYVQVGPGFSPSFNWTGIRTGKQEKTVSYSFTNSSIGIELRKQYYLTLHDTFEVESYTKKVVSSNPRQVGEAVNKTSNGQEVTLNASESKGYSVGVTISGEFGKKIADLLPIVPKVSGTYAKTGNTTTGYSVKINDLPLNHMTWLEVVELSDRYDGTANEWSPGGYVGTGSFSVDVPSTPPYTFQTHVPYVEVNAGNGGGGGVGG